MGRLFWKIFFAFFLALMATAITVGNLIHWDVYHHFSELHVHAGGNAPLVLPPAKTTPPCATCRPIISMNKNASGVFTPEIQFGQLFFNFPTSVLVFSLLWSLLFSAVLAWSVSHPIKLLLGHLRRAGEGDLQSRVGAEISARHDEFTDLGRAFDTMLSQLNNLIKSQSSMLHHVSHELRSPLARIQMAVGLLQQNSGNTETSLHRLELEAMRMDRMIAELLELFRLESGVQRLRKAEVNLLDVVQEIIADVQYESPMAKLELKCSEDSILIMAQIELLYRAIHNVIRNAVKYAASYGVITVTLHKVASNNAAIIEVTDRGLGVTSDELDKIFKPFLRGKLTTQVEGHGIGLAMTKNIVEAHGGAVKAINLHPKGFKVRMRWPLHAPPLPRE